MRQITITRIQEGRFIAVRTPYSRYFEQIAKTFKARRERGAWVFFSHHELKVRNALVQVFGVDGSCCHYRDVVVELAPWVISVDVELEIAGRVIAFVTNYSYEQEPVPRFGPDVEVKRGTFKVLKQGANLSPRIQVGQHGASVVLKRIPWQSCKSLLATSHPWIKEMALC